MKILLVEDDVVLRRAMQHLLTQWQYEVEIVSCGQAALAALQAGLFDVVLLDEQLPDMYGREIASKIRSLLEVCPLIIGLTGYVDVDDYQSFLAAGMDEVLQKPLRREGLRTTLAQLYAAKLP